MAVQFEQSALLKLLLHAIKYPHSALNGVFIGKATRGSAAATTSPPGSPREVKGVQVIVTDAIPLLHTSLSLTMPLDVALNQVDIYTSSLKGETIVGFYQVNERLGDSELVPTARRLGEWIHARGGAAGTVGVVLNSAKMEEFYGGKSSAPFEVYLKDGTRGWARVGTGQGPSLHIPSGLSDLTRSMVGEGRHRRLADFDDHLDDVSKDWLNKGLLS